MHFAGREAQEVPSRTPGSRSLPPPPTSQRPQFLRRISILSNFWPPLSIGP